MRHKRLLWPCVVIITVATGCDNVAFGGVQVELRAPERAPEPVADPGPDEEAEEQPLEPIELPPLLHIVELTSPSEARIVPVATIDDGEYRPLPDPDDIPDFAERFAIGRWEAGTEIPIYARGLRVGTFIADGTSELDSRTCRVRPVGGGHLEVRPNAAGLEDFIALASTEASGRGELAPGSSFEEDADLRAGALNIAQRLIPMLGVPWPQSIPEVRHDLQPFSADSVGTTGFAASHVFGDLLRVGTPNPRAYSLFVLASQGEDRFEPMVSWYQRAADGKAFPRLLGAHDIRGEGSPDAVLEVFGASSRWLAILGRDGAEWSMLYQDDCGESPARGAIRSFP